GAAWHFSNSGPRTLSRTADFFLTRAVRGACPSASMVPRRTRSVRSQTRREIMQMRIIGLAAGIFVAVAAASHASAPAPSSHDPLVSAPAPVGLFEATSKTDGIVIARRGRGADDPAGDDNRGRGGKGKGSKGGKGGKGRGGHDDGPN